jgi:cell division protein FtsL
MAAGQWLMDFGLRMGNVPARVQGVYSPVAPAPGVRRAHSASLGTPEIYFAKSIDNSRLVKITDLQRSRENKQFALATVCLFVLVMFYAWQHFSAIEYGYKIEAQKHQREELVEANRALRLEEASLRDPERIDVLARQMGLESPRAGQVVRLENTSESAGPVMARVTDVAVITVAQ